MATPVPVNARTLRKAVLSKIGEMRTIERAIQERYAVTKAAHEEALCEDLRASGHTVITDPGEVIPRVWNSSGQQVDKATIRSLFEEREENTEYGQIKLDIGDLGHTMEKLVAVVNYATDVRRIDDPDEGLTALPETIDLAMQRLRINTDTKPLIDKAAEINDMCKMYLRKQKKAGKVSGFGELGS